MIKKISAVFLALLAILSSFSSCIYGGGGNGGNGDGQPAVTSDSLYVRKVENLSDGFIMGMDASCVPSLEKSGVRYYDYDGSEKDVYEILSNNGINYIRVRIWNDPFDAEGNGYGGGNCDLDNAIEVGRRATKYGMKLLVNFHYSDFWADPGKQMVPKAWVGMSSSQMSEVLYQYTKESLQKILDAGIDVGMVQIGNETNGYMCGFKAWEDITALMQAGSRAVREACPDALVALHFTNPETVGRFSEYAWQLEAKQVDYDVFATSYYPMWHGTLENLATVLNEVAYEYGKKTLVAETAYANTPNDSDFFENIGTDGVLNYPLTEQGQANLLVDVVDVATNEIHNCMGVFYWEGSWISVGGSSWEENSAIWEQYGSGWATSYAGSYDPNDAGQYYGGCSVDHQAFFDANGKVRESLKVFSLMKNGNAVENKADAVEAVNLTADLNGDIILPDKVNAVMLDNSKQEIDVEWKKMAKIENNKTGTYTAIDYSVMRSAGVARYDIVGEAGGLEAHCYVSMVEYNFLKDWSFEDEPNLTEDPLAWNANKLSYFDQLYVEDKATDSVTGRKHFHFWGASDIEFTLEQTVENLKAGRYSYTISIMGGDGGDAEIYSYIKINGEIVKKADLQITVYDEWHTATVSGVEVNDGDVVTVGIYVKCPAYGWGKIDDAVLNYAK